MGTLTANMGQMNIQPQQQAMGECWCVVNKTVWVGVLSMKEYG